MIGGALLAIAAAMLLVRWGWAGRQGAAAAGWALATLSLLVLTAADGAWGLAVGTVVGTIVAIALLLHAGATSPAKVRRPVREAPAITLPRGSGDLARRLLVFVLVVPITFAAAQWLAFGIQALARRHGATDADTTALILFGQPLIWAGLMTGQMICHTPARMAIAPLVAAIAGTLLWSLA